MHLCCCVGGDGCKLTPELLEFFLYISPQKKYVPHGLGQAVYSMERESRCRDPPKGHQIRAVG
jgi:hypothetical protein